MGSGRGRRADLRRIKVVDFYAETTVYMLAICVLASLGAAFLGYNLFRWLDRGRSQTAQTVPLAVVPVMILGPLTLLLGYGLFRINFLYPIRLDSNAWQAFQACLVPAAILFACSGLLVIVIRQVRQELFFWRQKTFVTVSKAMGLSGDYALRRLVIGKSVVEAWGKCLPWVFGELIIVEVVFNAPGVGYAVWNFAKMRQFESMGLPMILLAGMYLVMAFAIGRLNKWLGVKLASYA